MERFDGGIYGKMYCDLFYEKYNKYMEQLNDNLFPEMRIDPKQYLEEYFGIDLTL
jgi:hypothetical protein